MVAHVVVIVVEPSQSLLLGSRGGSGLYCVLLWSPVCSCNPSQCRAAAADAAVGHLLILSASCCSSFLQLLPPIGIVGHNFR